MAHMFLLLFARTPGSANSKKVAETCSNNSLAQKMAWLDPHSGSTFSRQIISTCLKCKGRIAFLCLWVNFLSSLKGLRTKEMFQQIKVDSLFKYAGRKEGKFLNTGLNRSMLLVNCNYCLSWHASKWLLENVCENVVSFYHC